MSDRLFTNLVFLGLLSVCAAMTGAGYYAKDPGCVVFALGGFFIACIWVAVIIEDHDAALATGTRSAETGATPAQSEGCQSGGEAVTPNRDTHP